jgi:hypothetical protein
VVIGAGCVIPSLYSSVTLRYDATVDASQFRHLLKLGLGRAILYVKGHDVQAFRSVILDACLHCYAYDPQIEGTRADYMLELVDLTQGKEFYHEEVLNALPGSGDDWDAVQRFRFAACLAFDGNERAKQEMYQNYKPGPRMGEDIGIDFLQMDEIKGLLFAAEKMGELLMATKEEVDLGFLLSVADERFGEQQVRDVLRKAGTENPRIEAYRLAVEGSRKRLDESLSRSGEMINASYDQLKPKLPEMTFRTITSWGERASDVDIERAAQGLAAAQDPKEQCTHLRIFAHRRFPLDIQLLLSLVDVEQERVGLAALKALSQITHPAVRELAFRLVETRARWRGEAIELLARNFGHGDHAMALRWFEAEEDLETRHALGSDLIDLWERYPDEETEVPMLRTVYEQGPCSFCRRKIVRRLIERGALTEQLRSECSFDANDDIRELVKAAPATPPQG